MVVLNVDGRAGACDVVTWQEVAVDPVRADASDVVIWQEVLVDPVRSDAGDVVTWQEVVVDDGRAEAVVKFLILDIIIVLYCRRIEISCVLLLFIKHINFGAKFL